MCSSTRLCQRLSCGWFFLPQRRDKKMISYNNTTESEWMIEWRDLHLLVLYSSNRSTAQYLSLLSNRTVRYCTVCYSGRKKNPTKKTERRLLVQIGANSKRGKEKVASKNGCGEFRCTVVVPLPPKRLSTLSSFGSV